MEKKQITKVDVFTKYLANYKEQYLNGNPNAVSNDFIFKIKEGSGSSTSPIPFPADLQKCSYAKDYPGFLLSEAILQRLEKNYLPKIDYGSVDSVTFAKPYTKIFPNLVVGPLEAAFIRPAVENIFKAEQCRLIGRGYNESLKSCDTPDSTAIGRCPAPGSSAAAVQASHDLLARSIHISSASPIHMLKRFRDESPLTLTIPFSVMRDYVEMSCASSTSGNCSSAPQAASLMKMLDTLEPMTITTSSGLTVAPSKAESSISCTAVGLQRLYSWDNTFFGISQFLKYTDISMVRADSAAIINA
ncbi:hypothetical protein EBR21_06265, partial [bacterium]|nr:hypothetical protein [bacterium]